jgi:hypothetical protein
VNLALVDGCPPCASNAQVLDVDVKHNDMTVVEALAAGQVVLVADSTLSCVNMAIPFSAPDVFEFSEAHMAFSTRRSPLLEWVVVTYRCQEYSLRCRGASVVACTLLQSVQPEANFFNFIDSDIGALVPGPELPFSPLLKTSDPALFHDRKPYSMCKMQL